MSLVAVRCDACGGAVAMQAGRVEPRCLFCGAEALTRSEVVEEVEPPETFALFTVDEDGARGVFKKFAASSFWYPSDLRHARLDLNAVLLPAWTWSGVVDAHWAALVKARTRSGKRPETGSERVELSGVLVPSSATLTRAELLAIAPYESGEERPFEAESAVAPYELGSLTRSAARAAGVEAMEAMASAAISKRIGAVRMKMSCLLEGLDGRPVLLPVWIGAYRRGEKLYRVVINGQTGKLTGKAPRSWVKIGCAALLVAGLALLCLVGMSGLGLVGAALQ